MEYKKLLYIKANGVGTVMLNQPKFMNALEEALFEELSSVTEELISDHEVRAVVLTGSEKAFCAGGDVRRFMEGYTALTGTDQMTHYHKWVKKWSSMDKPTVASVNGAAFGAGLSLCILCDIAIASDNASFGTGFSKLSLVPDFGLTYLLPRCIGTKKALELMLTSRAIKAAEAQEMGIVNFVVPREALEAETQKIALNLASASSLAIKFTKKLVRMASDCDFNTLLEAESAIQGICFQTEDAQSAARAFVQKEPPIFVGR